MATQSLTLKTLRNSQQCAKHILSLTSIANGVILLNGTLGAGKTTLAKYIIDLALGVPDIADGGSPTFNIMHEYCHNAQYVYHLDFYRLKSPDDLYEIGFEDIIGNGLIIIEWSNLLNISGYTKNLPTVHIDITIGDNQQRYVTIS